MEHRLNRDIKNLLSKYPEFIEVDSRALHGVYRIIEQGKSLGEYEIEMLIPESYPMQRPKVREIGGKIPRKADFHVFPSEGWFCLSVPEESGKLWRPDISDLLSFLDGPVRAYLAKQKYFETMNMWPQGERSHGLEGRLEFYREAIQAQDDKELWRFIKVMSKSMLNKNGSCPCSSGLTIAKCHLGKIIKLRSAVPHSLVAEFVELALEGK